ncbi:MAG: hypothetical protein KIT20_06400 [Alphaproteobacteria bacterium]|nr:hypothetical protein [Alphaproteobacteria bacterium]
MPSSRHSGRTPVVVAAMGLALAYPVIVYFGLRTMSPQALIAILAAMVLLRLLAGRRLAGADPFLVAPLAACAGSLALAPFAAEPALRAYPVFLSLAPGLAFAWSLRGGGSVIERIARLSEPDLPKAAVTYTRRVTWVWIGFFLTNAAIAALLAWRGSLEAWTLYNGLISYLLAGTLMTAEYAVRRSVRRRIEARI